MNRIKITTQIAALFIIAIAFSFIGDNLHEFLGDWKCGGYYEGYDKLGVKIINSSCLYDMHDHNSTWHWGWRHWLLMMMGVSLFITQAIFIFLPKGKTK